MKRFINIIKFYLRGEGKLSNLWLKWWFLLNGAVLVGGLGLMWVVLEGARVLAGSEHALQSDMLMIDKDTIIFMKILAIILFIKTIAIISFILTAILIFIYPIIFTIACWKSTFNARYNTARYISVFAIIIFLAIHLLLTFLYGHGLYLLGYVIFSSSESLLYAY